MNLLKKTWGKNGMSPLNAVPDKTVAVLLRKHIGDPGIIVEIPRNALLHADVVSYGGCLYTPDGDPVDNIYPFRRALALEVDLDKMNWSIPLPETAANNNRIRDPHDLF